MSQTERRMTRDSSSAPLFTSGPPVFPLMSITLWSGVYWSFFFSLVWEKNCCALHHKITLAFLLPTAFSYCCTWHTLYSIPVSSKDQDNCANQELSLLLLLYLHCCNIDLVFIDIDIVLIYNVRRYCIVSKENSYLWCPQLFQWDNRGMESEF